MVMQHGPPVVQLMLLVQLAAQPEEYLMVLEQQEQRCWLWPLAAIGFD
jgi:hypothetical protein